MKMPTRQLGAPGIGALEVNVMPVIVVVSHLRRGAQQKARRRASWATAPRTKGSGAQNAAAASICCTSACPSPKVDGPRADYASSLERPRIVRRVARHAAEVWPRAARRQEAAAQQQQTAAGRRRPSDPPRAADKRGQRRAAAIGSGSFIMAMRGGRRRAVRRRGFRAVQPSQNIIMRRAGTEKSSPGTARQHRAMQPRSAALLTVTSWLPPSTQQARLLEKTASRALRPSIPKMGATGDRPRLKHRATPWRIASIDSTLEA